MKKKFGKDFDGGVCCMVFVEVGDFEEVLIEVMIDKELIIVVCS